MMKDLIAEQMRENQKLDGFIGRWHTRGDIFDENENVTGSVDAIDTYEWLPGKCAVIHHIDSTIGDAKIQGVEVIGYDPARKAYFAPFFDNQGTAGYEELTYDGETWIWYGENMMGVRYHRCKAVFKDSATIAAIHEHSLDGNDWKKWMDITLSKTTA